MVSACLQNVTVWWALLANSASYDWWAKFENWVKHVPRTVCLSSSFQYMHEAFITRFRLGLLHADDLYVAAFGFTEMSYLSHLSIQSNLVISNSLVSNYRLSRNENLAPVLT